MKRLLIPLMLILILLFFISPILTGWFLRDTAIISQVIDGDTVRLASGQTVRLLGINTPEKGQAFYQQATERLRGLIENRTVILETDFENTDKYGRLLRWIWFDDRLVNEQLVAEGLAFSYMAEGTKYEDRINAAQEQAQQAGLGLWSLPESNYTRCIGIQIFNYNAAGDDRYNLNDEYVILKNGCDYPIDMTGWTATDASNERFAFPAFVLEGLAKVTIRSGSGQSNSTDLFWGSNKPVWNNDGDTFYLRDRLGNLIISYNYG